MLDLSAETEALAFRLARAKRMDVEAVVREALEARAQAEGFVPRDTSAEAAAMRRARIESVVQSISGLPVLDPRPVQDLIDELNEA